MPRGGLRGLKWFADYNYICFFCHLINFHQPIRKKMMMQQPTLANNNTFDDVFTTVIDFQIKAIEPAVTKLAKLDVPMMTHKATLCVSSVDNSVRLDLYI